MRHKCYQNRKQQQPTIDANVFLKFSQKEKSDFAEYAAVAVCKDLLPFNVWEGEGMIYALQRLVNLAAKKKGPINVRDFLPTGQTMSNRIEKLAKETKEKVEEQFKQVKSITFCCDHWTEEHNSRSYLASAVQYWLDGDLIYRVLSTRIAEDKSRATNAASIQEIINEFGEFHFLLYNSRLANILNFKLLGIQEKVLFSVTDGDSALSSAFPHSIKRQSCKSHDLNRMQVNAFSSKKYQTDKEKHGYEDAPREAELSLEEIEKQIQELRDIVSICEFTNPNLILQLNLLLGGLHQKIWRERKTLL